jgi:DNA-binding MarR family transcriptional regulator
VPHKEIVAALGVTRATVSGLMATLERDGLVRSVVDRDDRRNLLASLTSRGNAAIEKAFEANPRRLLAAFAALSADGLVTLTVLLHRVRQGICRERWCRRRARGSCDNKTRRAGQVKTAHGIT